MICRYFLTIEGSKIQIPDEDLKNWDEIEYSLKRSDFSGVVRSFSSAFEFVGETAERISALYLSKNMYASAEIEVETMNDNWTYTPVFSCPLDFASYEEKENAVRINAIDNSLAAIIKANKGNKYDMLMSEFSDSVEKPFFYEGIKLDNMVSYKLGGKSNDKNIVEFTTMDGLEYQKLPLMMISEEIIENKSLTWKSQEPYVVNLIPREDWPSKGIEMSDRGFPYGSQSNPDYCFLHHTYSQGGLMENTLVRVYVELDLELPSNLPDEHLEMWVCTTPPTGIVGNYIGEDYHVTIHKLERVGSKYYLRNKMFDLYSDYSLCLLARVRLNGGSNAKIRVISNTFYATWEGSYPSNYIDYLKPKTLLNKLMERMVDGKRQYTCVIEGEENTASVYDYTLLGYSDGDSRLNHTILIPKDAVMNNPSSIRYIRTSFSDFCKWMECVFGYVYMINGDEVRFCHRSVIFREDLPDKLIKNINDVTLSVNRDAVFSSLEIGYEVSEDDAFNMRYEVNRMASYGTGMVNTERKMSLISPYKADCIGFELAYENGIKTGSEDKNSQDGIWFVMTKDSAVSGKSVRVVDKDIQISADSEIKAGMFNFCFAPVFCLKANSFFLSSFVRRLHLTSANINNVKLFVDFGNLTMKRDFEIDNDDCDFFKHKLFSPSEVNFVTDDQNAPSDLSLPVEMVWKDKKVSGYVMEMNAKYAKETSCEYVVIVKSINPL